MAQIIAVGGTGADSRRVLEAVTPLTGDGAPAVQASYLGQTYVDTTSTPRAAYKSVAIDSVDPADDWLPIPNLEAVTPLPLTGDGAPAVQSTYIGQVYVDITTTPRVAYMSVAIDSVSPADDWVRISNVPA